VQALAHPNERDLRGAAARSGEPHSVAALAYKRKRPRCTVQADKRRRHEINNAAQRQCGSQHQCRDALRVPARGK
jgi:hypothetical protein